MLDPGQRALVGFFGGRKVVEQADRYHRVVGRIDHVIAHESVDPADDGYRAFLDPACELFGLAGLGLALTNGGIHGALPRRSAARYRNSWALSTAGRAAESP